MDDTQPTSTPFDGDAREDPQRDTAPGAPVGETVDQAGEERADGRPTGLSGESRPHAEGRPSVVRNAEPRTPPAEEVDTEPDVDRGETPGTEHTPGGDL